MVTLLTTQDQFEALHSVADTRAKSVRVDAQALTNLLIDHTAMVRELRARGTRAHEPQTNSPAARAGRSKAGL